MNITYSIDNNLCVVTLKYTGDPDFDEWANTMRAVFRDPSFEPGYCFIMDRRLVTTPPTTKYIERIAGFSKSHPNELGNCFTAVVVSGMASYGMGRMSQALLGDTEHTEIFTDIEEAKQWLNSQRQNKQV